MIKEILSRLRTFRWQKLLIIWAVFVAMAAILFAERSGIQYKAAKFKLNYLPRTEVEPAQTAMLASLSPACCSTIPGRKVQTLQKSSSIRSCWI